MADREFFDRSGSLSVAAYAPPKKLAFALLGIGCGLPTPCACGGFAFVMWSLTARMCAGQPKTASEVYSPDNHYVARVKSFDCGATTDFSTWLELDEASHSSSQAGENTVFSSNNHPREVFPIWCDRRLLLIDYEATRRLSRDKSSWRDVEVIFRQHVTALTEAPDGRPQECPSYTPPDS